MNTCKPQLYLHIGHPKTASSSIQSFLYDNWQLIEHAGYLQPTAQLTVADETSPPTNPLWALQNIKEKGSAQAVIDWISAASKQRNYSGKLLLSSESLAQPEWPRLFEQVSHSADLHVIYYVRRQDRLLLSAWRQWGLKRGLTLNDFIQKRCANIQPNFYHIINNWRDNGATTSQYVRFIEAPFINEGNVIVDIASYLNLDISLYRTPSAQNISVDARLLTFFAEHPSFFSSVHDETIFDLLRENYSQPAVRAMLSVEQFALIHQTFEPINQDLLSEYDTANTGRPVLDAASAPISTENMPSVAEQHEYIRSRLLATSGTAHPLLDKLRIIMNSDT